MLGVLDIKAFYDNIGEQSTKAAKTIVYSIQYMVQYTIVYGIAYTIYACEAGRSEDSASLPQLWRLVTFQKVTPVGSPQRLHLARTLALDEKMFWKIGIFSRSEAHPEG